MSIETARQEGMPRGVQVEAGARLHMGFINPVPGPGRSFGSIGLALDYPRTRLTLRADTGPGASGPDAARALAALRRTADILGLPPTAHVAVSSVIPAHSGLGSGTQLALAVGMGLARLRGRAASVREIAAVTERGARSGIGTGTFEHGGFLLDGGRGPGEGVPPVIARLPFPAAWRVILVLDHRSQGLHGQQEVEAFKTLPAFPSAQVAELARLVLTEVLPALAEEELQAFGAAVTEIQERVGDHFAPAQGGRFTSPAVAETLGFLRAGGACALGQSSWGPTGFCVVGSEAEAEDLAAAARRRVIAAQLPVEVVITRARDQGARIRIEDARAPQAPVPDVMKSH